jgi:hypothetical protein
VRRQPPLPERTTYDSLRVFPFLRIFPALCNLRAAWAEKTSAERQESRDRIQNPTAGSQPRLAIFRGENLTPVSFPARCYRALLVRKEKLPWPMADFYPLEPGGGK